MTLDERKAYLLQHYRLYMAEENLEAIKRVAARMRPHFDLMVLDCLDETFDEVFARILKSPPQPANRERTGET
jgi:hypothetical protein